MPVKLAVWFLGRVRVRLFSAPALRDSKRGIQIHATKNQKLLSIAEERIPLRMISVPVRLIIAFVSF